MNPATPNTPPPTPSITPADRLGLTLCLAVIIHAVAILGISFSSKEDTTPRYEPMEIILVQQESEAPDEAKILAQANLEGGGESEETERPATPMPAPFPEQAAKVTAPPPVESVPPPPEQAVPEVKKPEPLPEPPQKVEQVAVETPEPAEVKETPPQPEKSAPPAKPDPEPEPAPEEPPEEATAEKPVKERQTPSAAELMSSSMEMAALSAEIKRKLQAKAERPRRKFISASTKEFKYASYMEAWRSKVERVGNLNYPEEARRRGLTGSLILDVAIKADGAVEDITIRRSSGNKILDDAAIRIVNLAAPFAPFPENIRKETDILHITRTWQFMHGQLR